MNTFGTLLLRIERPWLGVPLAATLLMTACQGVDPNEGREEKPATTNGTERRDGAEEPASTLTADTAEDAGSSVTEAGEEASGQHLLLTLSYENGVFNSERAVRVSGELRAPRSGEAQGKVAYVARAGASPLWVGATPDPRSVHGEFPDPSSQQMTSVSVLAPGKQYFLIHVPLTTDAIDFFDNARKVTPAAAALNESVASQAPPAAQSLIGTVSLEGLL